MSRKTIVKVCGMRDAHNIAAVESCGIDWMGFIFYAASKRCVSEVPTYSPSKVKKVGVFVNEHIDRVAEIARLHHIKLVQLHGSESPIDCQIIRNQRFEVIKAFAMDSHQSFPARDIALYEGCCDYFLFDTQTDGYGGSGKSFDWSLLDAYSGNTPFLLSGGISMDDIDKIKQFRHPMCIGIDINSRFETAPAMKNVSLIQEFVKKIRE